MTAAGPADARVRANRDNWDDRTPVHLRAEFYDVEGWLRAERRPRRRELDALGHVADRSLLHPQCHIGLDTLQFARVGARVTGLDFSPVAIDAARDIARRAGLADRATFVYDAVDALAGQTFDVVYVSLGALTWLPRVDAWAEQVGALLAPGGRFLLHDGHPLSWALGDDGSLRIEATWFEEDHSLVDDSGRTYTDGDDVPLAHARIHEWNHGIGEVVTALIRHGLRLEWLTEHDWTVWPRFPGLVPEADGDETCGARWTMPPGMPRIPLTFSLLATKPAT
jgi:SAM-dependent methyltransferase